MASAKGFALAITVNYPNLEEQTKRLKAYAGEVLMIVTLIFSAGCFTGILSETKMITEMAKTLVSLIPEHMGSLLPLSVASNEYAFKPCISYGCLLLRRAAGYL